MVTVSCTFKATQAAFQIGSKLAGSTQVTVFDKALNSRQLALSERLKEPDHDSQRL